ncbi:hypothetical protein AB833_25300 [Chromatiales bacterium (ex Bugula neritina AB1)]|nr:hypothetical protein AB833_25300 [Chromatiales bacterium (ex Bugula neritina AB1)]
MQTSAVITLYSRRATAIAATLLLLFASGCTVVPRITVGIDSISSQSSLPRFSYVLKSAVAGVDESDLHFIEYSNHIHDALARRGMVKAESADDATVEIKVDYGSTRHQRTVTRQVFHDDYSYSRRVCKHRNSHGKCTNWVHRRHRGLWDPWKSEVRVVTAHDIFVSLEARAKDAGTQPALWATRARALVAKPDLRVTLPLLLVAARDHIGTNTGHEITVVLRGDELTPETSRPDSSNPI